MTTAALSAYLVRVWGINDSLPSHIDPSYGFPQGVWIIPILGYLSALSVHYFIHRHVIRDAAGTNSNGNISASTPVPLQYILMDHVSTFFCAFLFGTGLSISRMCDPQKVLRFLDFSGPDGWDPSLIGVMLGGISVNTITFYLLRRWKVVPLVPKVVHEYHTMNAKASDTDTNTNPPPSSLDTTLKVGMHKANLVIDAKLIVGAMIFGVGWGWAGVCPGPALVTLGANSNLASLFIPALYGGVVLHELFKVYTKK